MSTTLDVFNADAFSVRELTAAIEKAPHKPGRIGQWGLFTESGITTTTAQVEEVDGQLSLIATSAYGAPAPNPLGSTRRRMISFEVPHLARESTIIAAQVQGVRAFGSSDATMGVQMLVNQRLATLRAMHDVTKEHMMMGALKGQIIDADGSTVVHDLFTRFGVTQQTHNFALSSATLNIRNQCMAALRKVEDELGGSVYTGARALCSPEFFDALIEHPKFEASFQVNEGETLRRDLRKGVLFGGIMWEEYRGTVTKADGTGSVTFLTASEALLVPEGVQTVNGPLFQVWNAPADFEETVNTIGLPIYAKIARDPELQRWVKIHSQSNPLPICLRPRCVIRLTKT